MMFDGRFQKSNRGSCLPDPRHTDNPARSSPAA